MGAVGVSRRALLARAGIGGGAGVLTLLGGGASPVLAATSISDLANVRPSVLTPYRVTWNVQELYFKKP